MTTATLSQPPFSHKKISFGEPKLRTDGDVLLVAFGKDGLLYSVEEMGVLRKWNPATGQQLDCSPLSDMETLWAFSADARMLASASDDLAIWDASSGRLLTSIPQPSWVTALAFAPDPNFLATGHDDGSIDYWDAPGHHPVFDKGLAFHKKPISALAISPDGKRLAAACEDKTVSLWDVTTGQYIGCLAGHTDRIPALVWHPSGKFLVSAGWDTTARVWDAETLQPIILLNSHATQVNALAFSAHGNWLACADATNTIHLWDFDHKKTMRKLKVPPAEVRSLAFSSDGKYLACNGDRILHLWNPETGEAYASVGPHSAAKTVVSIHPDGKRFVSNNGGGPACVWSVAKRQPVTPLGVEPTQTVAFSPDGKWIAAAVDKHLRLWDAAGKSIADWQEADEPITTLAFSPDSTRLASGSRHGTTVWIWRVADGMPLLLIPDALDGCSIESLAFLPDGKCIAAGGIDWMATGGTDGAVSLWHIDERHEFATFLHGASAVAVHPSGACLAATTLDHAVCIWELKKHRLLHELSGHDAPVTCLAYSPDGHWLATGSEDLTLRLWDCNGREQVSLDMDSQVTSIAFAADGKSLFLGHANTTCSRISLPESLRRA